MSKVTPAKETFMFLRWHCYPVPIPNHKPTGEGDRILLYICMVGWVGAQYYHILDTPLLCRIHSHICMCLAHEDLPLEHLFRPPAHPGWLNSCSVGGGRREAPTSPCSVPTVCKWKCPASVGGEVTCKRHGMSKVTPAKETFMFLHWHCYPVPIPNHKPRG